MNIKLKANLSEDHSRSLVEECYMCFVGITIKGTPEIKIDIKTI